MMVIRRTWSLMPWRTGEGMASLSLDVAGQMMVSEGTGFMFERGQSLRAVGRVKVAGWRPLIALFAFPGCACFDRA
jgi:hypothetical protein